MILGIDTGNTHTVLGCIDEQGNVVKSMRMETNPKRTEYEYASDISRILELYGIDFRTAFEGVVISSVVPDMIEILKRAVKLMTGLHSLVVGPGIKTGLDIGLDDPGQIAADLVASAVGAKNKYPTPTIIIDMGTATTMTVLGKTGRFLGGAIVPGVALALGALASGTSLLPRIELSVPKRAIGTNTVDCMKSGNVFGAIGALDGLIERFEAELGERAVVVATGGLAKRMTPYCKHEVILDEDLLLYGLYVIWEKNKDKFLRTTK